MKTGTDGQERCHGWPRAIGIGLFAIGLAYYFNPMLPSLLAQSNPPSGEPGGGPTLTLDRSSDVLNDVGPNIPSAVFERAICVVVVPASRKAAFIVGGAYGRGVISCRSGRTFNGPWSSPAMVSLEGGRSGLQMSDQASDFVLLIMNKQVATSVLSQRIKIGSDVSVSAGPDRNETEIDKTADILSYSRARGLFAGETLSGSTIRPNNDGNRKLYGRDLDPADLVLDSKTVTPIPEAARFMRLLNRISPKGEFRTRP